MMNYVKSEIYRISHDTGVYLFTAILAGLSCLLNAILFWYGRIDGANFPYNTTSFSYSNLVANPMFFCIIGAIIGIILYDGSQKNGSIKNTVAFGIPRTKIFAGQCIVAVMTSVATLFVVLTAYVASAFLLLERTGAVTLTDLITEIPAIFLIAVAALISAIICIHLLGSSAMGMIVWIIIWFIIPKIFFYLGLRIDLIYRIAMWMPENMFGTTGMIVDQAQSITAWGTAEGMAKCIICGGIAIIIFSISGILTLRKREL